MAQPVGMCARSRTKIASSYAFCEEMRTLSRPRADGLMMDWSSARMTNLSPSTEVRVMAQNASEEGAARKQNRTVCEMFASCFALAYVVDATMGRIILGLPIPTLEEAIATPLVFEIEGLSSSAL